MNKMHSHAQQSISTEDQQRHEDAGSSSTNRNDDNRSTASAKSAAQTWYKSPPPRTGDAHCQIEMDTEVLLHQEAISVRDQILLDTGSTMDLLCNSRLLSGMPYLADKPIQMLTNAGTKVHRYQGKVPVFKQPVWFDPMAITNIMSLNSLKRDHDVIYDQNADTFTVYDRKTGDTIAVFESNEKGLYLFTPDMNVRGDKFTLYQDIRSDHLMKTNRRLWKNDLTNSIQRSIALAHTISRDTL